MSAVKPKLLVHTCCAPCLIAPLEEMREDFDITLFWYNPNIHPYMEYQKRRDTLRDFALQENIPVIWQDEYDLDSFLCKADSDKDIRCPHCYALRMLKTAQTAAQNGFDAFTTTLLYSKYQRHEDIMHFAHVAAERYDTSFYYEDWRCLWQKGIELSRARGMYRQPYCGCIYSEKERYYKAENVLK